MDLISDPTELPEDAQYHTVSVMEEDDGSFFIGATANEICCMATVDSVSIGEEAVGLETGNLRFGQASQTMELTYTDFDQYDYDEIQITFEDRQP